MTDVQIEQPTTAVVQPSPDGQVSTEAQVRPAAGSMILFEAVRKVYEPDVVALDSVSFAIDKGEFVFIVGASGSGKTTLVRLLLKELEPSDGRIILSGRDLGRLRRSQVPRL
ncbi:MAG TPA: ATP-binding cassette domain-containing protein, partial [Gaiellaceae bacterium]|nr:ATP-binding cassette domain-containing protein [Gaiellaceae bacterium]